ncbi:MAG: serine/threonine protein kinase [Nannocystaceae bacterium]|nr:serine/threonine protein kinase [Nannocystaceae bacterium]
MGSGAHAAGLAPGTRLDRYTLIRRLAMGGMAELYLAQQTGAAGFSKIVALKRIHPHLAQDETFTRMFLSEARLASDLNHSNLAHVLDFGECNGEHYLTMEYVHGANLLDALRQARAPLPMEAALQVVIDVARGLHELHEHRSTDGRPLGMVHRDVSPSNVLLAYDGSVKLTDFGIAKAMELTSATSTGTFKGKLGHSSPEQARGEKVDRRSDVFCLGILLYEVTTGARAFSGPNEFAVLGKVASANYDPPESLVDDYPHDLAALVRGALSASPQDRPASAAAFAESVAAFARKGGIAIGPGPVAMLLRDLFGEPPPIADPEELDRVTPLVMQPGLSAEELAGQSRAPRRPWLAYALVPLALVLGAAGTWSPVEPHTAQAMLRPPPQLDSPEPAPMVPIQPDPALVSTPLDAVQVGPMPQDVGAPAKPRRRRKTRPRKPKPQQPEAPNTNIELRGMLFPPDP